MLLCQLKDGIYEGSIMVQNKEINGIEVEGIIQMVTNLAKIDVCLNEIQTMKVEVKDLAQMYKLLEEERGSMMLNGAIWRGRTMETIRKIFNTIIQASSITDAYENHEKVIKSFLRKIKWSEKMEFISVGWVEGYDGKIKVNFKMTKRNTDFIKQRIELFNVKTKIANKYKENTKTSTGK